MCTSHEHEAIFPVMNVKALFGKLIRFDLTENTLPVMKEEKEVKDRLSVGPSVMVMMFSSMILLRDTQLSLKTNIHND